MQLEAPLTPPPTSARPDDRQPTETNEPAPCTLPGEADSALAAIAILSEN